MPQSINLYRLFLLTVSEIAITARIVVQRRQYWFSLLVCAYLLSGCSPNWKNHDQKKDPTTHESWSVNKTKTTDSTPLIGASKTDIFFAQRALNALGYKLGNPDGIWGPKSARAIRDFENSRNIKSAGGHLSKLNLQHLENETRFDRSLVPRSEESSQNRKARSLSSMLDRTSSLESGPQLIILETDRKLMVKPNPYSEVITTLKPGSGIYVIRKHDEWYEVESENNLIGYLNAN